MILLQMKVILIEINTAIRRVKTLKDAIGGPCDDRTGNCLSTGGSLNETRLNDGVTDPTRM